MIIMSENRGPLGFPRLTDKGPLVKNIKKNSSNDIIAYHGSNFKITSFESGSYFTPDRKEALSYAQPSFFNIIVRERSTDEKYLYKVRLKSAKSFYLDWNDEVDAVIMEESDKYDDLDDAIENGLRSAKELGLNFIRFSHPTSYNNDMVDVYVNTNTNAVEILEVINV